jgi:stringent starvation protein B
MVPVSHVLAIYARENGQGMSFPFIADPVTEKSKDIDKSDVKDRKTILRVIK